VLVTPPFSLSGPASTLTLKRHSSKAWSSPFVTDERDHRGGKNRRARICKTRAAARAGVARDPGDPGLEGLPPSGHGRRSETGTLRPLYDRSAGTTGHGQPPPEDLLCGTAPMRSSQAIRRKKDRAAGSTPATSRKPGQCPTDRSPTMADSCRSATLASFRNRPRIGIGSTPGSGPRRKKNSEKPLKILNLFGYTGLASLLPATEGAQVTHVDASKKAIGYARENQALSGLEDSPDPMDLRRCVQVCCPRSSPRQHL
jgi:hypothetical protein